MVGSGGTYQWWKHNPQSSRSSGSMMGGQNYMDPNYWMKSFPGMSTLMGGGLPMQNYDPTQYTGAHMGELNKIMHGSQDQKLAQPGKYLGPMMEQARMGAKGAKNRALTGMQAAEGPGFDPAMQHYMGGVFDSMPSQMMPEMSQSAAQSTAQENAPLIAANAAQRGAAMQGLTNLAGINAKSVADMLGLKYSTMNQALMAGVSSLANLMTQSMGQFQNMLPTVTTGYGGHQYSGKTMPGADPWSWFMHGNMQQ